MGISTLQFWRRYSEDLSPNNSFISSSVTFEFKFSTYNILQFCFSCWLGWYFSFWIWWSTSWRFFWWCLFCWCCWKLSLIGWAILVRCNSDLSCVLVCYFANNAAWMFWCFARDSDSTIADCVSNKLLITDI